MACSANRRCQIVDRTQAAVLLAICVSFRSPTSHDLAPAAFAPPWTGLGAEYCAAGHEVFLIVPGRHAEQIQPPTGVVRITVPARLILFTGGYRAVLPGPVRALLEALGPDTLEVSDRLTLRSLGRWGREHGATTVMISHERLDRLAGQVLPRRTARAFADFANRRTAANYDTVVCTTGFAREEFDRSAQRIPSPSHWAWTWRPSIRADARSWYASAGRRRRRSCWCTAAALRKKSGPTAASMRWRNCVPRVLKPDWSSWATAHCGPGCSGRPQDCRSISPVSFPIGTPSPRCWPRLMLRLRQDRTKPLGWLRWNRWHVGHRLWFPARRRSAKSSPRTAASSSTTTPRPSRKRSAQSSAGPKTTDVPARAQPRRDVHVAARGGRNAEHARRRVSQRRLGANGESTA